MFGDLQRSRIIAYSAAFIGLIALGSWISLPIGNIPFTLQTLFVLLAGIVMHRYGAIPVLLYCILGVLGLPLFHNGMAGIGVLLGPTGGYLIGFIFAGLITGLAYEHTSRIIRICGIVCATLVIYLFGVAWLMLSLQLGFIAAVTTGMLPFIPGCAIKAAVAYIIGEHLT
ncbi:MAG: biotin transporter BioY [Methanoregula sp.]|jgi:biotin transport system substrate-specific component|nr:biotin transporter BioY [Methanoregula sp.]